jgi:hypothetical protein
MTLRFHKYEMKFMSDFYFSLKKISLYVERRNFLIQNIKCYNIIFLPIFSVFNCKCRIQIMNLFYFMKMSSQKIFFFFK